MTADAAAAAKCSRSRRVRWPWCRAPPDADRHPQYARKRSIRWSPITTTNATIVGVPVSVAVPAGLTTAAGFR